MKYAIGINGRSGRVGRLVASLLEKNPSQGQISLELTDKPTADLWIDFSHPSSTMALLEKVQVPVVIGTTGFKETEVQKIRHYAEKVPVVFSPNMGHGIFALSRMLKELPLIEEWQCEGAIIEEHHKHKVDAPSGTAKMLAKLLMAKGFELPVFSVRAGETLGTHTLRLVSSGEELTFTHRVTDRAVFAEGALRAAYFLLGGVKPGIYSMEEVK